MRYVQFAQPFAQHFGEIIIVIDMRQELAVGLRQGIPVHAVHVHVVEACLFLAVDVVEDVFAFFVGVHLHFGTVGNRFQFFRFPVHLLHGSSSQYEEIPFAVGLHIRPARVHFV